MASKRRLSKGVKAALPLQEEELAIDEDLNIQSNSRRNSFARRRQSVGKAMSMEETEESIQDQNRIADMYKSIIKMSSENKINAKNSWNLDLITHMDKMIKSDENTQRSGAKGVNFQKASCTLDASIKIYSHRVDDTWSSSYRILENLSRSEHIEEDDLVDDDDDDDLNTDGTKSKKASRVGTKSNSNKLNLIRTIEKNIKNLNYSSQENSHTADPMFHKMSLAFDEGGAKGMLMSNLRVCPQSSTIMFSALDEKNEDQQTVNDNQEDDIENGAVVGSEVEKTKDTAESNPVVNENSQSLLKASKNLLTLGGVKIEDLLAKTVCSSLNKYRDALDIIPLERVRYSDFAPLHHIPNTLMESFPENEIETDFNDDGIASFSDDDDCDVEETDFQGETSLTAEALEALGQSSTRRSSGSSDNMSVYSSASKIQWDAVYDKEDDSISLCGSPGKSNGFGDGVMSVNDTNPIGFQSSMQNAASTAAFLAMHSGTTNQWAGAKHWRRSTRQKTSTNKNTSEDNETSKETKSKKSKTKKEKFRFDFSNVGEGVSDQINTKFEKVKGSKKQNPTILSDAVVQKGLVQAQSGSLTLPADARLNTKDLCRLFHWSSMIVPPTNVIEEMTNVIRTPSALSYRYAGVAGDQLLRTQHGKRRLSSGAELDTIWVSPQEQASAQFESDSFDHDCGNQDFDMDDDDDNFESEYCDENEVPNINSTQSSKTNKGLVIEMNGGLLQAPRKVNKLDIGYAQSSKRVNVKKLKTDLWSKLEHDCSSEGNENISNDISDSSTDHPKELSFQNVICDIAQDQPQKDASLPFYFICLLHLANEKNLCIKDSTSMDDLKISQGSTH